MLAYIKGTLEMKMTGYVVIDVGGLGYKVFMSEVGIDRIGNIGENVKVYTHYRVREDDISIYGFNTLEELRMFELLIGASGVGAKTALAVISEDVKTLTGIPGIGPKSAKRIILELKDKIKMEQQIADIKNQIEGQQESKLRNVIKDQTKIEESMAALQVLGYNRKEIEKVFEKLDTAEATTEELIKKALVLLAR